MVGKKLVELNEEERMIVFECLVDRYIKFERERNRDKGEKEYLEKLMHIWYKVYED